jgi:hypothetical protein
MKYTNRLSLPKRFFNAVVNDPYDKGGADFSITELLDPPKIRVLQRAHAEEIEEDVSDYIFTMLGKGFHLAVENAHSSGVAEKREEIVIDGFRVSGAPDLFEEGFIYDWKVTGAYKVMKRLYDDWEKQLNGYAMILRSKSLQVKGLRVMPVIRDWNFRDSFKNGYPKAPALVVDIPLWEEEKAVPFFRERISLHMAAERGLPDCTDEETWQGRRCERFCSVSQFCVQFQKSKKGV